MTDLLGVKIPMNPWVVLPLIVLATAIVAHLINIVVLSVIRRAVGKTSTRIDNRLGNITNYPLPERELAVLVHVRVDYSSDLKKVENITCEAAKEVL